MVEKQKEELRKKTLRDCLRAWNSFIQGLLRAQAGWEKYCDLMLSGGIGLEEFPLEVQKIIYTANPHGEYSLLVDDLLTQPPVKEYLLSQILEF